MGSVATFSSYLPGGPDVRNPWLRTYGTTLRLTLGPKSPPLRFGGVDSESTGGTGPKVRGVDMSTRNRGLRGLLRGLGQMSRLCVSTLLSGRETG